MAAIPFCVVPGADVTHFVIERIEDFNVPIFPNATVYDTLLLPAYKPFALHVANYAALVVELGPVSPSGCICGPRKAAARGFVNAAWALISTPALRAAYDANVAPGGFAAPCLARFPIPWARDPPDLQPSFPFNGGFIWSGWNPEISNVKGTSVSFAIDPMGISCRKRANSFWLSLNYALGRNYLRWAETKAAVDQYYTLVRAPRPIPDILHPRDWLYFDLNMAATARGVPGLRAQLNPDAAGVIPSPIHDVTAELWQVVADAFGIELIVVFDAVVVNRRRMTLARGDHNARQIFLLLEADGAYSPLEPTVRDPPDWRYTEHIPKGMNPRVAEYRRSAEYRSPLYQIGPNNHLLIPLAPIIDQSTGLPHVPLPRGGLGVPLHVVDEPDPASTVAGPQILAYLNTGEWM